MYIDVLLYHIHKYMYIDVLSCGYMYISRNINIYVYKFRTMYTCAFIYSM